MDFNPSIRPRRPVRNTTTTTNYHGNNSYEYQNDEFEENEALNPRYGYQEDDNEEEEDDDEEDEYQHGYYRVPGGVIDSGESSRRHHHQKKRRLDNLVSNYEFAPRNSLNSSKNDVYGGGGGDRSDEWNENASFVLLEVWGDRYLQLGRKSLRSDDWIEVSEKVSEICKMEINELQCRNRLETLKKKYKKEKSKDNNNNSKWIFFKKMDMLLCPKKQHNGLPCGVDSGEYVFMNTKIYLNQSNALDEMRDSPGESESDDDDDDDDERMDGDDDGFRLLAESVQNFGEIYEKIEGRKRQQMMELEKMRMDFQRDLELQKKQILEKAQTEIAKIREEGDDDDEDGNSVENLSG